MIIMEKKVLSNYQRWHITFICNSVSIGLWLPWYNVTMGDIPKAYLMKTGLMGTTNEGVMQYI